MFFSSPYTTILLLLSLSLNTLAHPHATTRQLPGIWHFPDDHPVRALFARQAPVPPVGSAGWRALYPGRDLDLSRTPRAWTDALNAAVAAGRIPGIPVARDTGGNPEYPPGNNPNGPQICSSTAKCRAPTDVWDSPTGNVGISFDDGPVAGHTEKLLGFLKAQNQTATHFMIGVAILAAPTSFTATFNEGGDLAVHTWSHPHMTTLSNEAILAQLGWTMQIISDSSGGRVPRYWRPPYGDADNRVRAIAEGIFGLTAILWNYDTEDWTLSTGGTTVQAVDANIRRWYSGPKSPGLMILHHELSDGSVQAFMDTWPLVRQNGWNPVSAARISKSLDNKVGNAYWNAPNGNQGTAIPLAIGDRNAINRLTGGLANPTDTTSSSLPNPTTNTAGPTTTITTTMTTTPGATASNSPSRAQSGAASHRPFVGSFECMVGVVSIALWTLFSTLAL